MSEPGLQAPAIADAHDIAAFVSWADTAPFLPAANSFLAGRESLKPLVRQLVAALDMSDRHGRRWHPKESLAACEAAGEILGTGAAALAAAKAQGFEPE